MKNHSYLLIFLLLQVGCVGTDLENDPKDSAIMVDVTFVTMTIGEMEQLTASYWFNMWVEDDEVDINWLSSNPAIAIIDQTGLISAIEKGQTSVLCFVPGEDTMSISVNVVEDVNDVAKVVVTGDSKSVKLGETLQLVAQGFNTEDVKVQSNNGIVWNSSDVSIASVSDSGLVTALSDGLITITATIDGIVSEPYPLIVGFVARLGVFMDANGYNTSGMATLFIDSSGDLILELSSDFQTSFALGTFLYMANSTTGSVVGAQGLEVSEISGNGGATFNLSQIDSNITIDDYQYVILLCKPFSITFGSAELN